MTKAVDILARQTVAGLGGTAMKTCLAYIKNALTKPEVRTDCAGAWGFGCCSCSRAFAWGSWSVLFRVVSGVRDVS